MQRTVAGVLALTAVAAPAVAAEEAVELSRAWTPAATAAHADSPLYLTVANHASAPDNLLRVRCPTDLADFVAKHVNDKGEGGTVMREVKSFAIPAGGTTIFAPGGDHLMLLNLRQPLPEGQTFTCSLSFQQAGTLPVEVKVAPSGAKDAP